MEALHDNMNMVGNPYLNTTHMKMEVNLKRTCQLTTTTVVWRCKCD